MFKINTTSNRITSLEEKRFSDLGFSERSNLQERLEHSLLEAFGKEMLLLKQTLKGYNDRLGRTSGWARQNTCYSGSLGESITLNWNAKHEA